MLLASPPALAQHPAKKRGAPPHEAVVSADGVTYRATTPGDEVASGNVVVATETRTGRELWRMPVATTIVDPRMERDKREVLIARLALAERRRALIVTDERGGRYRLDLATRAVTPLGR